MNSVKGLDFLDARSKSMIYNEDGLPIRFIHLDHLLLAKKAAGRNKDLDDIENLTHSKI